MIHGVPTAKVLRLFLDSLDHVLKVWEILERRDELEPLERELLELAVETRAGRCAGWMLLDSDMPVLEERREEIWWAMVFIFVLFGVLVVVVVVVWVG